MPITEEQYNTLMKNINDNPPDYNPLYGLQCSSWTIRQLVDAKIIPSVFSSVDNPITKFAIESLMYNPYTQFIGFEVSDLVNDLWLAFKNWVAPRPRDPLILDLDGDGIETLGINATTHVVFDFNGDGVKTGTGWIAGDEKVNCVARETTLGCGFVVLDRNGNGTIDNGGELYGDQTLVNGVKATDGFAALSGDDSNSDGVFDANDANFANIRIWQEEVNCEARETTLGCTNSDGISQSSELHTLSELGITAINLTATQTNTTTNGNLQTHSGTYTKVNGDTGESGTLEFTEAGAAGNLNFSQNPFYSEFADHLILTDTALALPDMQGSGMVHVNNQDFRNERRVA